MKLIEESPFRRQRTSADFLEAFAQIDAYIFV
jgi:hypothetical protein